MQTSWFQVLITVGVFLFAPGTFDFEHAEAVGFQPDAHPLILHDGQEEYLLGTYVEHLEDLSQNLDIEQVSSPEYGGEFIRGNSDILNFGLKDSVY